MRAIYPNLKNHVAKKWEFFRFFFLISKYNFPLWCKFLQNSFLQTLELFIWYKQEFYDLRTKGTKYEILKKKLIFFWPIFTDFCRFFGYLFFWDVYIARATPRANYICYANIYMISKLTHKKYSMCTHKAHYFLQNYRKYLNDRLFWTCREMFRTNPWI